MRAHRKGRRLATLALAATGWLVAPAAHADPPKPVDKQACNAAYTQAQTLRNAHRLTEARAQLRVCAQPTCAAFIVSDCTGWLPDVEARIPSVVLIARDAAGSSLSAVTVSVDGATVQKTLDGQSIDVDPGTHTFAFTLEDGTKVDQTVVVPEGQKAQIVTVIFPSVGVKPGTASRPGATVDVVTPPMAPEGGFWTTQHVFGAALGGVGLAGVVVGAVFGGLTFAASSAQNNDCGGGPTCANHGQALSDHSSAVTDGAVSTIGFIAGGALVAGGAALLLTGGRKAEGASAQSTVMVVPSVGRAGGGALLRMEF